MAAGRLYAMTSATILLWLLLAAGIRNVKTESVCLDASAVAGCTTKLVREVDALSTKLANSTLDSGQRYAAILSTINGWSTCSGTQIDLTRPLQFLVVDAYQSICTQVVQVFYRSTGWVVTSTYLGSSSVYKELQNMAQQNLTRVYDGVIFSNKYLTDVARSGLITDLSQFISQDPTVQWADMMLYFRVSSAYNGKIVGMPLVGMTFALYYRRDVLEAHGIKEPPHTWDDFVTLAERFNGTDIDGDGVGEYSVCHSLSVACQPRHLLMDIAANLLQYNGPQQGFIFDPDTLEPLIYNPAMAYAVEVYRRLARVNLPAARGWQYVDTGCPAAINAFLQGKCIFSIQNSAVIKGTIKSQYKAIQGLVGSAPVPGSTHVLDRSTNQLVRCTASLCPYASVETMVDGSSQLVNYSPWKGAVGYSGSVFSSSATQYQQIAFQFLSTGASSNITWAAALSADGTSSPVRESQLSGGSLQSWMEAGYNEDDVRQHLTVTRETLGSSNAVLPTGLPDQDSYQQLFEDAAFNATFLNNGWDRNTYDILKLLDAGIRTLVARSGGTQLMLNYYRETLGLPAKEAPAPASYDTSSSGLTYGDLAAAVASPVAFVAAVALVMYVMWLQQGTRRRGLLGRVRPPPAGPDTTLMLTDVQDSTTLYELLPAHVMDQAMKIHHDVIAAIAVKNHGYLVLTEGDSFLVAFHQPMDAVLAACDIQEALLEAPWPDELLAEPRCNPVWVMPRVGLPGADAIGKLGAAPATSRLRALVAMLTGSRTSAQQEAPADTSQHAPLHMVSALLKLRLKSVTTGTPPGVPALAQSPAPSRRDSGTAAPTCDMMASGAFASFNVSGIPVETREARSRRCSFGPMLDSPRIGAMSGPVSGPTVATAPAAHHSGSLNPRGLFATITQSRARRAGLSEVLSASSSWSQLSQAASTPFGSPNAYPMPSSDWHAAPGSSLMQSGQHRLQRTHTEGQDFLETGDHLQSQHLMDTCTDSVDRFMIDRPAPAAAGPSLGRRSTAADAPAVCVPEARVSMQLDEVGSHNQDGCDTESVGSFPMRSQRRRSNVAFPPPADATEVPAPAAAVATANQSEGGGTTYSGYGAMAISGLGLASRQMQSGVTVLLETSSQPLPNVVMYGGTGAAALPVCCVLDHLQRMAPVADGPGPGRQMVFAGLRVRIALHSGIPDEADVVYNKAAGRMAYSGPALALLRKVLSATVWGGVVILTEATCKALPVEAMRARLVVAHEGEHVLGGKPSANGSARPGRQLRQQQSQQDLAVLTQMLPTEQRRRHALPGASSSGEPLNLYRVIPNALLHRTYLTAETIKSPNQLCHGFLRAPYASGAVVFMNAVGVQSLMSWDATTATEALSLWRTVAQQHLYAADGYLAESAEGLMLAVFSSPASAARWALTVVDACLHAPWPQLLLEHELGEEVAIVAPLGIPSQAAYDQQRQQSVSSTVSTVTAGTYGSAAGSISGSTLPLHFQHLQALHAPASGGGVRGLRRSFSSRSVGHVGSLLAAAPGPALVAGPAAAGGHGAAIAQQPMLSRLSQARSQLVRTLLFRGLRLKCGIDHGQLSSDLHHVSGRIMYRGRVMNRAARVAGVAKTGQVWMTAEGWAAAAPTVNRADAYPPTAKGGGLMGGMPGADGSLPLISPIELEPQKLKGISEEVQLVQLSMDNATTGHTLGPAAMPGAHTVMAYVPPSEAPGATGTAAIAAAAAAAAANGGGWQQQQPQPAPAAAGPLASHLASVKPKNISLVVGEVAGLVISEEGLSAASPSNLTSDEWHRHQQPLQPSAAEQS